VGRRQNKIAVGGGIAAWFTQHPQTQIVRLGREIAHFVEHGLTRYVENTADNDPTRLPAGVKINRLDHVGKIHGSYSGCGWPFTRPFDAC